MLLLFNKTIKSLNQFTKKSAKEVSVIKATADDFFLPFLTKYFFKLGPKTAHLP